MVSKESFGESKNIEFKREIPSKHEKFLKDIIAFSPGMLYGGLDLETAKTGKSTCRNEAIAEAFHYMRIAEAWGTGIPRIINRCNEYGLPAPVFEEFGDGFKVVQMVKQDYKEFDYIIGMDDANVRNIMRICGGDPEHKIAKLLDYAGMDRSIADPWYTGNFDETYDDVVQGCEALMEELL